MSRYRSRDKSPEETRINLYLFVALSRPSARLTVGRKEIDLRLLSVVLETLKSDLLPANEWFLDTKLRFRTLPVPALVTGGEEGPNIHGDKALLLLFFDFSWNDLFKNMFIKKPLVDDVRSFSLFFLPLCSLSLARIRPFNDHLLNNSSALKINNDIPINVLKVIRPTITAIKKNGTVKITLKSNILFKPISFSRGFVEIKFRLPFISLRTVLEKSYYNRVG